MVLGTPAQVAFVLVYKLSFGALLAAPLYVTSVLVENQHVPRVYTPLLFSGLLLCVPVIIVLLVSLRRFLIAPFLRRRFLRTQRVYYVPVRSWLHLQVLPRFHAQCRRKLPQVGGGRACDCARMPQAMLQGLRVSAPGPVPIHVLARTSPPLLSPLPPHVLLVFRETGTACHRGRRGSVD